MSFEFLTLEDVLHIQELQISQFGGEHGVRDLGLLESAVQTPRATYAGQLLHEGIFAVASAYLFHIVQNHPFVDGNKRTGSAAALVFLEFNGIELNMTDEQLVELTISVATGKCNKSMIEAELRAHAIKGV